MDQEHAITKQRFLTVARSRKAHIVFDFSAAHFTARMTAWRKPDSSRAYTPSMVVPAGEQTASLSSPGCCPVSRTIFADPSTVCAANRMAEARVQNVSLTDFDAMAEAAAQEGYIQPDDIRRLIAFRDNPSDESWIGGAK